MDEQTGRRWRIAFFGLLAMSAGGVLMAMQPATPKPAALVPVGGITWVPDGGDHVQQGRLLGVTADGTLIETERVYAYRNDSWRAWRAVRREK